MKVSYCGSELGDVSIARLTEILVDSSDYSDGQLESLSRRISNLTTLIGLLVERLPKKQALEILSSIKGSYKWED